MFNRGIGITTDATRPLRAAWDALYPRVAGTTQGALRLARAKPLGAVGAVVVLIAVVLAVFGDLIAPFDPVEPHYDNLFESPGSTFLLGTDNFGRDQLSRLIVGARPVLFVSVLSVLAGTVIGAILGLVSGFRGGWADLGIQRVIDGLLSLPTLILALSIVSVLGPSDINVVIALAVVIVPTASRVVRSVTLSAKEEVYVEAARSLGASDRRIIFRHLAPNTLAPLIVLATNQIGWAIVVVAALSFLGISSPPPEPSWGRLLSEGVRQYANQAPWLTISSAIFITFTVFGFAALGDAVRDLLDPRLRGANVRQSGLGDQSAGP